jgi:hypothetical protein
MNTVRERFAKAYRIRRLMKHKVACSAALRNFDDLEMLTLALKCTYYPTGYFTSGGVWFARQAARNGYSFKKAIRSYLRAVKYRQWRRERSDLFPA